IDNRAGGAPSGDVITLSFGLCEQAAPVVTNELFDAFYAIANAQGQTVLVAAGDDGGRDCFPQSLAPAVSGLASSPHVVAVGGTLALASAPALVNRRLGQPRGMTGGLGQLLPDLYRVASEQARGVGPPVFRDVVTGSNGAFVAGPGFDLATGWGAPLVDALAGVLDGPGPCEPDLVCMVPSGRGGRSCAGEWLVEQELFLVRRNHLPAPRQTCRDGDPQCDADGAADGHCTLRVALCLNVFDTRGPQLHARGRRKGLPLCQPGTVHGARLLAPRASRRDPTAAANHQALAEAIGALPLPTRLDAACTATVPVIVPVNGHVAL